MELKKEHIAKAVQTLEGAKVVVLNREFDDFQNAIITAINALNDVVKLTEENERLKEHSFVITISDGDVIRTKNISLKPLGHAGPVGE